MANLQLRRVRKSYDNIEIIRGIDLDLHDEELTVFVGPSGCGKSTLLRMIAGLEEITSGDLFIDGERVNDIPPAKRGLALVFQSYALYPHMTVAENMSFSLKLAGLSKAEREMKVAQAAQILHLESLLTRKPKELSGGQRQRVAIGRAIVRNPKVFLFDEPLSNLDAELRVRMRLELTKLHRQLRATMIYVTHDQVEAMTMADRIVVLNAGVVEQVGTPMELYRNPRNLFVAGFLGSPKMNFLTATVESQNPGNVTVKMADGSRLSVPGQLDISNHSQITIGIRPEHLRLTNTGSLAATVTTVEHLGSESYLHVLTANSEALIVRVSGETAVEADQQVNVEVDSSALHLFDQDGTSLRSR